MDEILGDLIHYLFQFDFNVIYKKGKENILADLLSWNPELEYFDKKIFQSFIQVAVRNKTVV